MKFKEYSKKAKETQLEQSKSLGYLALGLCGEIAEFLQSDSTNFKYEAGDIIWYLDRYADAIGSNLEEIIYPDSTEKFSKEERSFDSKSPDQIARPNPAETFEEGIVFGAGELAEITKKYLRDNSLKDYSAKESLFEIYTNLVSLLQKYQIEIEEVVELNVIKLTSRKKRGVIQGSGDHR